MLFGLPGSITISITLALPVPPGLGEAGSRLLSVVTVSFADEGGRTKLTLQQAVFETGSARDDHVRGWTEALEHLVEYLRRVQ